MLLYGVLIFLLTQSISLEDNFDSSAETKECPKCAETIKAKANIYRYCAVLKAPDFLENINQTHLQTLCFNIK